MAKIKKYHILDQSVTNLSIENYNKNVTFLIELLDQYWNLIELSTNERKKILEKFSLCYLMFLNHIDHELKHRLQRRLEQFIDILQSEESEDSEEILYTISNYILSQGYNFYNKFINELNSIQILDKNQIINIESLPLIDALLNRNNSMFYYNGQFKISSKFIPDDLIIDGIPFIIQKNLVYCQGINIYYYNELMRYNDNNLSFEQVMKIYTEMFENYINNFPYMNTLIGVQFL